MIDVHDLLSRGCAGGGLVGIGVSDQQFKATGARLAERRCSVRLERFEEASEIVSALKDGSIDAAVRGTLPSNEVIESLKAVFGLRTVMRSAILASRTGKPFILAPVGIDEGRDMSERHKLVVSSVEYFGRVGWRPSVAVLSKGRDEDSGRGQDISTSLEEGEELSEQLVSAGLDARHYAILVERAVEERDLIVAPDGVSGNLMFRMLHLVGGCEAYGAPVVNMDRIFVDTSRAKADFSDAVLLASGLSERAR